MSKFSAAAPECSVRNRTVARAICGDGRMLTSAVMTGKPSGNAPDSANQRRGARVDCPGGSGGVEAR